MGTESKRDNSKIGKNETEEEDTRGNNGKGKECKKKQEVNQK